MPRQYFPRLSNSLLVDGYEAPEIVNRALRETGQFADRDENPLWEKSIEWWRLPSAKLASTLSDFWEYIFESDDIQAGPYLHIADTLLRISEFGGLQQGPNEISEMIRARIDRLDSDGNIPKATFGVGLGWDNDFGRFSYGGYAHQPSELFQQIIDRMEHSQVDAFERSLPAVGEELCRLMATDLQLFGSYFDSGRPGGSYFRIPILHHLEIDKTAELILVSIHNGNARAQGSILRKLAERHGPDEKWEVERNWARELKMSLISRAKKEDSLNQSRLQMFLQYAWKFEE